MGEEYCFKLFRRAQALAQILPCHAMIEKKFSFYMSKPKGIAMHYI
jgi:hypothetical protein